MSLRPEISGFSLQKMFDVLGCKDEEVLRRVTDEFDSKVTFRNPSLKAEAHNVLRRAIFDYDGNRWPDLEVEGEPHVFAAIVLAAHGQELLKTESNHWKMPGIWDFIEQNYPQFSGEGRKYLKVFVEGRGIFGRKIKTYWSYYSFLQRSELDAALRTLTQFRDADPARQGGQFHYGMLGRLLEWLTAIRSKQMDLWFYCY